MGVLTPLAFSDVAPVGDLRRRAELNLRRLHDAPFHFEAMVHASTAKEAPGDWIGREILGLTLLGQTLRIEPKHLEEIIARLPEALNARGYIGPVHPAGTADENQVGGHNALLRGLCEFYLWKRDPRALAVIRSVVKNLMLPTRELYAHYPERALEKLKGGQAVGLTVKNDGPWIGLSTDVGTVFFTLDGLTQAYLIEPSPELRGLIETMMARYARLDVVAIGAQTHATLTTLRAILGWWREVDASPAWLALVVQRFRLYREHAETEHHANYNWFGRPEWTEACAVIDAFMLAGQLWAATGDAEWLAEAHRIYYNAMSYAQRPNGGYGCDHCVGAHGGDDVFLTPHAKIFEAPWCCTMRGAEGLARAAQFSALVDAAVGEAWFPFYFEGAMTLRFADGEIALTAESGYPYEGRVAWTVIRATIRAPKTLHFFVPPGASASTLTLRHNGPPVALAGRADFVSAKLTLAAGDTLALNFELKLVALQPQHPARFAGHHRFFHGPLLLGVEQAGAVALLAEEEFRALGRARYECRRTGARLGPIDGLTYLTEGQARAHRVQLLFPERLA